MTAAEWPDLDATIEVDESAGPLDQLWERFEVFEAIHHRQRICNPMREPELQRLVDLLGPTPDRTVLDIACGSGEFLLRCHERSVTDSIGVDLSPWMLQGAARTSARLPGSRPRLVLGDASKLVAPLSAADIVVCIGADWIWHGMSGTVAAIAERTRPGGRVAYGGPRLHFDADPAETTELFGHLETAAEVEARLDECGLRLIERIDPGEHGWRAYLDRGRADVLEWQRRNPGPRADSHVASQREWSDRYDSDRGIVGWSVWIADRID